MARVWGVQDADDKLSGWVSEDETDTAPTGETAVLESVIRAADPPGAEGRIQSGGHWDGTTYTQPVGDEFYLPFDPTTDVGSLQVAAGVVEAFFDATLAFIDENENVWTDDQKTKAREGIYWQRIQMARVVLNATRTVARRLKFCEECISWPDGVNGNVTDYVDAFISTIPLPTKDWSWVDPEADPFTRHTVMAASVGFNSATNVENAPSSADLIGNWKASIPS